MPSQSPFQIDIPATDLLSYLFSSSEPPSDKPIWIDADDTRNSLSPRQLLQWAKRLGSGLQEMGLKRQDVVMMYSTNHIYVPVAYLRSAGCGCIYSGYNPGYGVEEVVYQIKNTECKVILDEPPLLETLLEAANKMSFPTDSVFLFSDKETGPLNGIKDWRSFLPSIAQAEAWKWHHMDANDSHTMIAALNYSSGTTGLPQGVMISHQNVIANVSQRIFMRDLEQPYTPSSRPEERWLGFLPLYHAYGQLWSIVAAARTLSPCYFMRAFNYAKFLENIQKHRITYIQTAPPVLVMLAKRPETKDYNLSSLRNILCGTAPLSKELQNEVSAKFNLKVLQTWGMTEVTCSCLHVPGGRDDRSGSVGYIDPNASIKLIDDDATQETFDEEGFLKTGDIAVKGEEGRYWIVDRKKELIKVKGFQVAPAELEALLLEHEHVADAAVCALQLEHEELPRAYVTVKSEHKGASSERDIEKWIAVRVAKHKQLSGGVVFIDEVPKSPSGKIQRKVLREWAKQDAEKFKDRQELRAKL
ncbi:4-coumarate:coenzyme A ligase [Bimuria novae-zelandiae CBS 107.79]|uniref:4-coumarate:coenzyme A ligase n=1 Tax=Bimuria novae-zelandiae CBS 107.79 TaxID=1447943 RepID=A0A6A5US21_9PLEO|nr:4-coumarate:coenzyme A ligase [Bimuria novae-zelandiae CBS 107.79]